ncbi:MAG: rRNA (cytidine-2'-O-)-methyltransferase, partial [Chloroflexota bacterium]|nr:rRNA (cytidine-2'-O-)-methyltransferase [Chloroflexota bacterium]
LRRERLAAIAVDERPTVLYEAPGRVAQTLDDLVAACGEERRAAVCRELTKLHEEVWRGTLSELFRRAAETPPRGEVTIVVGGAEAELAAAPAVPLEAGRRQVERLMGEGWSRSSAAREVAQRTGLARRELFRTPPDEA